MYCRKDFKQGEVMEISSVSNSRNALLSDCCSQNTASDSTNVFAKRLTAQQSINLEQNFASALAHFYELHQRSQITGVPTNEYNAAIRALGLDPDKDPLAGIHALQENGFSTAAPSLEAILEYGDKPQLHGNQAYLAQDSNLMRSVKSVTVNEEAGSSKNLADLAKTVVTPVADMEPNDLPSEQVSADIQDLNTKYDGLLGNASNYYEAAVALNDRVDIAPFASLSLNQALPKIWENMKLASQFKTTEQWLRPQDS